MGGHGLGSTATTIEVHAIPISPTQISAVALAGLPGRLAGAGREHGFFTHDQALDAGPAEGSAGATSRSDRQSKLCGIRVTAAVTVSTWQEMPSVMLGVIFDPADVALRTAAMLRLAAEFLPSTGRVAIAIGLVGLWQVMEGSVATLGHQSSGTIPSRHADPALVEARDGVPVGVLAAAADEIAWELAMRLALRFRQVTHW